ncbi:MAG: hypothetical protein KDE19_05565 [Caldilineaceae bacterium]|nr:hypothetical protein [Caldilineaceae bacterium]
MQHCTRTTILILALVLIACATVVPPAAAPVLTSVPITASTSTTSPTPRHTQTNPDPRFTRRADGSLRLDLAPDASPTEAAPTMEMRIVVTDEATDQPVKAAIYLGGRLLGEDTDTLVVLLGSEMDEQLTVHASDYRAWSMRVRYRVLHHKVMAMPVRLQPLIQPRSSL